MSKLFKPLLSLAIATLFTLPLSAQAGQVYDSKAFAVAQDAGKSILVDVTAPWCPTCAKQKPILQGLEASHPAMVVFDVDFDSAKDVLKQFHVSSQSTLIVFKGKAEMGRSTGETDPAAIAALLAKGM